MFLFISENRGNILCAVCCPRINENSEVIIILSRVLLSSGFGQQTGDISLPCFIS